LRDQCPESRTPRVLPAGRMKWRSTAAVLVSHQNTPISRGICCRSPFDATHRKAPRRKCRASLLVRITALVGKAKRLPTLGAHHIALRPMPSSALHAFQLEGDRRECGYVFPIYASSAVSMTVQPRTILQSKMLDDDHRISGRTDFEHQLAGSVASPSPKGWIALPQHVLEDVCTDANLRCM